MWGAMTFPPGRVRESPVPYPSIDVSGTLDGGEDNVWFSPLMGSLQIVESSTIARDLYSCDACLPTTRSDWA